MTKAEALEYFTKLATDAGLDENAQKAVATALGNEKFAEKVAEGFMLESDYSRNKRKLSDEKKKSEEEYAAKYSQLAEWARQHNTTIEQAQKVYAEYQKYRETYGDLSGNPNPQPQNGNGVPLTAEQLQKLLDERDARLAGGTTSLLKDVVKFSGDYQKRFGEPIDVDAFDQFIADQRKNDPQLSVAGAYKLYIEPKVEERRTAEFNEKLKQAREEGARDALSKHRLPVDSGPKEFSPAWDPGRHERAKMSAEQQDDAAREAFFEEWNKAGAAAR